MNTKLHSLALAALLFIGLPLASSSAQVGVSITAVPPELPVVEQPPCPVDGYLWTPGYWAYGDVGYYWTPGLWVAPPEVGLLWTPPYWGFANGAYVFNDGYWGPTVGFYGGINYGYGYVGSGYYGGQWAGNVFRYNTAVTRVNTTVIHNTYEDRTVVSKQASGSRASFNGPGGVKAEPTAEEKAAAAARHVPATSEQVSRHQAASKNRDLQASVNHGHPKADAIKSFDQTAQKGLGTEKGKAGSEKLANKPENAAKVEATPKKEGAEESRSAERKRAEAPSGKATPPVSGRENVTGPRREMNEKARTPRRAESAAPGHAAPSARGEASAAQQRKGKPAKPTKPERTPSG
jgi:WXXGXW repeat (2 copies)